MHPFFCSHVWPLHYVRSCRGRSRKREQRSNFTACEVGNDSLHKKTSERSVCAQDERRSDDGSCREDKSRSRAIRHHAIVTFCLRAAPQLPSPRLPAAPFCLIAVFDMHTKVILFNPLFGRFFTQLKGRGLCPVGATCVQQADRRLICRSHDDSLRMEYSLLLPSPPSMPPSTT